ncbi:hypothetical protein BD779DRAFT_1608275 [Infundibulicybe gibba]|nr:hypothetical protein BD779DRAFT_1608275 [Infundibulicybe gibba]
MSPPRTYVVSTTPIHALTVRQTLIPPGYTFLNVGNLMTVKAKCMADDLLSKAGNRNPDAFDMYIYNDFYPYALLDLVDKTLRTAHSKISKKDWDEGYSILEALFAFMDIESSWPMCDDGEHTKLTDKACGALVVALLRGLKKEGRLNAESFPSLRFFLQNVAGWGDAMNGLSCDSNYSAVCKAIGKRLFQSTWEADCALEKAQTEEWANGLEERDRALVKRGLAEMAEEDEDEDDEEPWFAGGNLEDEDAAGFALSSAWKQYRAYLQASPNVPQCAGGWDISKWTPAQKKEYEFDGGSDSDMD